MTSEKGQMGSLPLSEGSTLCDISREAFDLFVTEEQEKKWTGLKVEKEVELSTVYLER